MGERIGEPRGVSPRVATQGRCLWVFAGLFTLLVHVESQAQGPATGAMDNAGDPLPSRGLQRFGTARWRHGSGIQCLAFSPVGQMIAAGGGHDPIRLWDSATGREVRQFPEPWINAMAFTRRGGELVTGGALKVVRIWDLKDGKQLAQLSGHKTPITAIAVSTDNNLLASGSQDGVIFVWEKGLTGITQIAQFDGHTDAISALSFSTDLDSAELASGSADRTVRVWHVDQKKMNWKQDAGCAVTAVTFIGDQTVASAGDVAPIKLWNAADGKALRTLEGHPGGVVALAASRDGNMKTLASSGDDAKVRLWDIASGKELQSMPRHAGDDKALAMSKDGQSVACGGANHTIRMFDVKTGKERLAAPGLQAGLAHLALAPDGKTLATVTATGTITIWDRKNATPLREWAGKHQGEVVLAYTPDGKLLVSGSRTDSVRFWDPNTGQEAFQFPGKPEDQVLSIACAPRGAQLAVGYRSGAVDVWDWSQKRIVQQPKLATPGGAQAVAFAPDGALLAIGGIGKVMLWDLAKAKEARVFDSKEAVNAASLPAVASLAFSSDRKTLAVGCYDGAIRLVDHAKGKEIRSLDGHGSVPYSIAFSTDGRVLVSGSFDKTVRLWEAFSGLTIATLPGHQGLVNVVAISADGRTAFSAASDTNVIGWDVTGRAAEGFDLGKTAIDFQSAWLDLASLDAQRGHHSLWGYVVHHQTSVPYLGKQLYLIDPKRIDQYFKDLGDEKFTTRLKATKELEKYGRWMEGRFRAVLAEKPDLEVQRRIEQLLGNLTSGLTLEQERIRVRRVMLFLEQVATAEARQVLQSLVDGAPEVDLQGEARISLERLSTRTK